MIISKIKALFRPELFHGDLKKSPYFEGWYYKVQDISGDIFAFIPGVSIGHDSHSFIQVINSKTGSSEYLKYPLDAFLYDEDKLKITVGESVFERDSFHINAQGIKGSVKFTSPIHFSPSKYTTGIMGPFALIPFLECRHAVITVRSGLEGTLDFFGSKVTLDGGVGYIEKDWGSAFPKQYIWLETGSFLNSDAVFTLSAAAVPIIGHVINGVIAFLYYKGRIFRFAAYTGARITILQKENDILKLFITSPRYELRLLINSCNTALLIGPTLTSMNRDVKESINGSIKLELVKRGGEMIFKDESQRTSVELCGDIRKLI